MATTSKANRPRCGSLVTRSGKIKLKPLNIKQLTALLGTTSKKKVKAKILNRIRDIT